MNESCPETCIVNFEILGKSNISNLNIYAFIMDKYRFKWSYMKIHINKLSIRCYKYLVDFSSENFGTVSEFHFSTVVRFLFLFKKYWQK